MQIDRRQEELIGFSERAAREDLSDDMFFPGDLYLMFRRMGLVSLLWWLPDVKRLKATRAQRSEMVTRIRQGRVSVGTFTGDLAACHMVCLRFVLRSYGVLLVASVVLMRELGSSYWRAALFSAVLLLLGRRRIAFTMATVIEFVIMGHPSPLIGLAALIWVVVLVADIRHLPTGRRVPDPLAVLSWSDRCRLFVSGCYGSLQTAVNKALFDDPTRADLFANAVKRTSPEVEVFCQHVRAVARARAGHPSEALALIGETADSASDALSSACALMRGDILVCLQQWEAAHKAYLISAESPQRGPWWTSLALQRLARTAAQTERWHDCVIWTSYDRIAAIRRGDAVGVVGTEYMFLRAMAATGDIAGARKVRAKFDNKDTPIATNPEHALVSAYLAEEPADILAHAYRALRRLRESQDPILEAAALLAVARAQDRLGDERAAIDACVAGSRIVNELRYALPTTEFRLSWAMLQVPLYALLVQSAYKTNDTDLYVEAIEALKHQSVPLRIDATSNAVEAGLAATLWSGAGASAIDREGGSSVDLVARDSAIRVKGWSVLSPTGYNLFDLPRAVSSIGPSAWLLTGLAIDDYYFAAAVSSIGEVTTLRTPVTELAAHWEKFAVWLPVGDEEHLIERMCVSPLTTFDPNEVPRLDEVQRVLDDAVSRMVPTSLLGSLAEADPLTPIDLLVSLVGMPNLVPFAAARVGSNFIAHVARLRYAPSLAPLLDAGGPPPRTTMTEDVPAVRVAILAPDLDPGEHAREGRKGALPNATKPLKRVGRNVMGPVGLSQLRQIMAPFASDPYGAVVFVGHVNDYGDEPAAGGVVLGDGHELSTRSLLNPASSIPLPHVVVISGCTSLGYQPVDRITAADSVAREWLGLAAGLIRAGAHDVICTRYPILDDPHASRVEQQLVDYLNETGDASESLRRMQQEELRRQDCGLPTQPHTWQSYVCVSRLYLGSALLSLDPPLGWDEVS